MELAQQVNVVVGNKDEEQLHRLLWSSGSFDQYALEFDQMKKNEEPVWKLEVPFLRCEALKVLEGTWGAQKRQCKTMAKSIWTQKEETIGGDENDIIFA